ncbi:MAG: MBL fold metallo-hydrolase [Chromatiaceae bacterium]|jgi:ribonuclease BN (tRNA processing enzyme)|nr:MBL fold metallo-hydrolase [Chromatiaceae bacterium]
MSDVLRLRFLGVGNAAAHALGNSAAVVEDAAGQPLLLIDCGPTVLPAYRERYAALPTALFITHTHLDHTAGLESLFYQLACEQTQLAPPRLYLPADIVRRLQHQLADDPFKLAEGGVNFWDRFQVIPVGDQFWHAGRSFEVFPVDHHGYRAAFGIAMRGYFLYTGDTRPIPEVLAEFAPGAETVFHDCGLHGSPSHTGSADLATDYPAALRERLVLYHYESPDAAEAMRALGYRVAGPGECFELMPGGTSKLRRVV